MSLKIGEANCYKHGFGCANYLTLTVSFISYEKWLQREIIHGSLRCVLIPQAVQTSNK